jgi:hypothetical protein
MKMKEKNLFFTPLRKRVVSTIFNSIVTHETCDNIPLHGDVLDLFLRSMSV